MKTTDQKLKVAHEYNVVTEDGRRIVATCGGYQNNQDVEGVHNENIANAQFIAAA